MRARLGTYYSRLVSRFVPAAEFRLKRAARSTPEGRPRIHLTFDDGPTGETPALLDVLAEHGIGATFFLLGENARRHPRFVRRIVEAGHEVGNHSMIHLDAWRATTTEIEREFDEAHAVLSDLAGREIRTMRPPFGRLNRAVVRWVKRRRQRLMMWDLMPPDFESTSPERVARTLVRGVRRGSIVVLHDNAKSRGITVPALRSALPVIAERGWVFTPPAPGTATLLTRAA